MDTKSNLKIFFSKFIRNNFGSYIYIYLFIYLDAYVKLWPRIVQDSLSASFYVIRKFCAILTNFTVGCVIHDTKLVPNTSTVLVCYCQKQTQELKSNFSLEWRFRWTLCLEVFTFLQPVRSSISRYIL